jgi:hypothetical protein
MVRMARWLRWAAAGAVATLTTTALANGRYPRGQYLKESPTDPNALVLSATYGLLITHDRGKNWYLVCERGLFGKLPADLDVIETVLEQTASGALISGSDRALRVSRDRGCGFTTNTDLPVRWDWYDPTKTADKGLVADLTLEKTKGEKAVLALVADVNGPATDNQIYESLDDALTWKPFGKPIPASIFRSGVTLDVAPSDGKRIYASGRGKTGPMVVAASTDGGDTWNAYPVPDTDDANGTYIAAISASDPNVLYARTNIWLPDAGGELGEDRLHYSSDGGKTWTELLRKQAKLMGFALSPDGKTVLAGYGNPDEPNGRHVADEDVGIYRADAGTSSFTKIYDGSISCLTWNQTGLYVCTKQNRDGFHLGFAPDASFDLSKTNALQRLLSLPDVRGPLPWAPGSGPNVCNPDWLGMPPDIAGICQPFGACRDGGLLSDPPLCGATTLPDGGTGTGGTGGSGSGSGGSGGSAGKADAAATGGAAMPGPASGSDCDCSLPGARRGGAGGGWALLLAAGSLARRRRRGPACRLCAPTPPCALRKR